MSIVTEHLRAQDIGFEALEHPPAHRAMEEALLLGARADMIAKAVVLDTPDGHAVAVVPGGQRLDLHHCEMALGCRVTLATEDELRRDFPDFEPGVFPAVPSLVDSPFIIDPEVMERDMVIIAGGDPHHSARLNPADLFDGQDVRIMPIAARDGDDSGFMIA